MAAERLRSTLTYLVYRAVGAAITVVPEPVVDVAAELIGTAMGRWSGSLDLRCRHIERVLASDSAEVAPDPEVVLRWARRSYRSYARYWVEGALLPSTPIDRVRRRMVVEHGYDHLRAGLAAGKGVVMALPHVGGWEWGGAFLASEGSPMTSVAERVEPAALFEWFVDIRRAMGLDIVPLGEESGKTVLKVLRAGGLVGLLCDRDIVGNGVEVEFFGERTTFPAGPATLALRTGATLLGGSVYLGPGRCHHAALTPALNTARTSTLRADVGRITQDLAHCFEDMIRRAPEQWHLYQPNWPSDRAGPAGARPGDRP